MPHRDTRRPGWRGYLPRSPRYLGRRGAMLLVFGVLWIIMGAGTTQTPLDPDSPLVHERFPEGLRGSLWLATGALAIFYAWRPPGLRDAVGFVALYAMPATRVLSFGWAYLDHLIPWIGGPGQDDAWRGAVVYAAMIAAVVITAGWPEPPHQQLPDDHGPQPEDYPTPEVAR